ncbi:MAG TPA: NAD(P)H-quinone oxidoreductase [Bryobacteraceae bacterium]
MIAIEISSYGPPAVLKPVHPPQPEPSHGEVVIRVEAAGVARADTLQRQGKYPPPSGASDIPGLDVAGEIDSIGPGVGGKWKRGDRVCAILAGGGYAEYCAAPAEQILPIPEGWTSVEAATLPENLFTVYDNLITRAQLKSGETVLIHGGSSGIGSMAIMLAQAWGATAIATAGSPEKCRWCLALGARHAIDYKETDFAAEIQRFTDGGANVILDMVGGAYLDRNLDALAVEGRLAIVASQGGKTGQLDIAKLMKKRGRIMGSTMRARTAAQKGEVARRLLRDVWPLLTAKAPIRPVTDSTFPLIEAFRAHSRMENGEHMGKIVLIA